MSQASSSVLGFSVVFREINGVSIITIEEAAFHDLGKWKETFEDMVLNAPKTALRWLEGGCRAQRH